MWFRFGFLLSLTIILGWLVFKLSDEETFMTEYYDPWATTGIFNNQEVAVPKMDLRVLGENESKNNSNKYIEVDLTNQKVYTFENGNKMKEYTISSGLWDRTPTGTFTIWIKLRSQKMEGGSKANGDYYYLPNVPYILFFYNENYPKKSGFSFHGTYWHNNFGKPMSHGCINMKTADAAELYSWAEIGTKVTVYGKYTDK